EAAGIRVRYNFLSNNVVAPFLVVNWKSSEQSDCSVEQYKKYSPTGDADNWRQGTWSRLHDPVCVMTAWTCQKVQTVRVSAPSANGALVVHDVTLLVAP